MDQHFTDRIQQFLQLKNPSDDQIIEGAKMLLQLSPSRNRGIYNSALRRPKSMLPWIRTDLRKYLNIRKRGLETGDVERYNQETLVRVKNTLSMPPSTVMPEKKEVSIPVLGSRGIREDHDSLPEVIRTLWDKNADRWRLLSKLHFQLAQMIAKPGYAPCDGNELCFQMRQIDDALRKDYETYDSWQPSAAGQSSEDAKPDSVDVFTDNVKVIQNARTAVSRGLARKTQNEESLKNIQSAVNTLFALKQVVKPVTVEKLKAIGITIPKQ